MRKAVKNETANLPHDSYISSLSLWRKVIKKEVCLLSATIISPLSLSSVNLVG